MSEKKRECEYVIDPHTFSSVLINRKTGVKIDLMDSFDIFKMCDGNRDKIALWTMVLMIEAGE